MSSSILFSTFFEFFWMNIPRFQCDDTCQRVQYSIVRGEEVDIAPWSILELIVGNPQKARWKLRCISSINILHKSHPCSVISRYAYLSILHGAQHRSDSIDMFLNLDWPITLPVEVAKITSKTINFSTPILKKNEKGKVKYSVLKSP